MVYLKFTYLNQLNLLILLLLTEMSKRYMFKSDKVLELRPCCHLRIMTLYMKVIGNNNCYSLFS